MRVACPACGKGHYRASSAALCRRRKAHELAARPAVAAPDGRPVIMRIGLPAEKWQPRLLSDGIKQDDLVSSREMMTRYAAEQTRDNAVGGTA